jgi:thymidylate synthase
MARHFEASTVDDLMHLAVDALRSEGAHINPTKGGCSEIAAATFELTNPRARVSRSASRGRLLSALGELCWYLSGSNRTEDIAYYVKYYQRFDENGVIFGGYGPRLVSFDGINQIELVIQALRRAPASRRIVIQLFDHRDVAERHADVPCTCTLQYLLRDGRLSAITYMRSNDVFLGLPHDLFCFTMLQELFARSVEAELGSYHHMVGSLHMYDENTEALEAFVAEGWHATTHAMPAIPLGDPWAGVARLLKAERQLRIGTPPADVDFGPEPYWADLGRLLGVYAVRKGPREAIERLREAMDSDYYACYITDRIDDLDRTNQASAD